jgi:flavin reductase (DIM6/NTAB) family NADH-FMN oxidoreductase RutF
MTDGRLAGQNRDAFASGSRGGIRTGAAGRSARGGDNSGKSVPSASAMRAARRRWTTGVGVLTTLERSDQQLLFRGATVSSFTVLSLEPPLVLVALETGSRLATVLVDAGVFAVSVLDRAHEFMSDRFSGYGPQPDGGFTGVPHDVAETGCPILAGALAWFDCRVTEAREMGDHVIAVGEVLGVGVGPDSDDPLINYEGAYRRIGGRNESG